MRRVNVLDNPVIRTYNQRLASACDHHVRTDIPLLLVQVPVRDQTYVGGTPNRRILVQRTEISRYILDTEEPVPTRHEYSERIRWAMKTARNPTGSPITIKQLAEMVGYSYENVRKVFRGEHDGSPEFNERVCRVLGLDEASMWTLAQQAKAERRLGLSVLARLPKDLRLVQIWPRLTDPDRERLVKIAEGLALAAEVARRVAVLPPRTAVPRRRGSALQSQSAAGR